MPTRGRNNLTEESIFFVTTTVVRFLRVFSNPAICDILIANLKYYQTVYKYEILAYVIMPSHFHWIVAIEPHLGTISDIMRDIKRSTSKEIISYLKSNSQYMDIFSKEAEQYPKQERKFWMRRFDDEVIRNDRMFWQKVGYIHNNPVKAGLVEVSSNYKYSSAGNYISGDNSIIEVNTSFGGVQLL